MTTEHNTKTNVAADASTVALFQQDWKLYRKMVDNNFLFHREAYAKLRRLLVDEYDRPFRFLDIACGDASASVSALRSTRIARYHGIDFSRAALDLARSALKDLDCGVTLDERDFLQAMSGRDGIDDVIFIGLSLHHLQTAEKLAFMVLVRRALAGGGCFVLYENTSPDGEDRNEWLRRWDSQRSQWTAYSDDEWNAMRAHVHAADFPETVSTWHQIGRYAGFTDLRELFAAPSDLFRMYCFRA